jgi:hypothetical protein
MGPLIGVLVIAAVLGVAVWQERHRRNNPWSGAFGTTFAAVLLLVPGLLGYELHKSNWSIVSVSVTDGPVWWQIYLGLAFVLPAAYFWRKAIRALP